MPDTGASGFERLVLGEEPAHSGLDLVTRVGLDAETAQRVWRALGFPELDVNAVAFTEGDAQALRLIQGLVDQGVVDLDTALNLTRAVGQAMARLADWDVISLLPKPRPGEDPATLAQRRRHHAEVLISEHGRVFEDLLVHAWRRHLAASLARTLVLAEGEEGAATVTVGFADLVAFTALSNEIGEDRVGDLVEVFESRCADVISTYGGRVIKSLGDSVLFVVDDASRGLDIADGIINVIGRDGRMPDVRLGLASGPVAQRLGDVFGPAVNLAARLTTVARRNRVIVDEATAQLLPRDRFEVRRLPARHLRGFGLVEPVAVRRV